MGMSLLQVNPKIAASRAFMRNRSSTQKEAYKLKYTTRVSCKANFYEVLSLGSKNVGFDEIKKAYRSMALQYHPDVCPPSAKEESTRRFVELREAYEALSNPDSRELYDYELGGQSLEIRRSSRFPKEVWETQLYKLKQRSKFRMRSKRQFNSLLLPRSMPTIV